MVNVCNNKYNNNTYKITHQHFHEKIYILHLVLFSWNLFQRGIPSKLLFNLTLQQITKIFKSILFFLRDNILTNWQYLQNGGYRVK